jgi:hypothetical protein
MNIVAAYRYETGNTNNFAAAIDYKPHRNHNSLRGQSGQPWGSCPMPEDGDIMRRAIVLMGILALAAGFLASASSASSAGVKSVVVRVYAFPAPNAYPHVHGATVPLTLVATTTTTSRAFSVSLSGRPNRTTDFVAIGLSGGSIADQYFFSERRAGAYTMSFPDIKNVSTTVTNRALARPDAPNAVICTTHFDRSLGTPWGIVGATFSTTTAGSDTFTYERGASSSIGIGTSATGAAGTFSGGGTNSVSTDTTIANGAIGFSSGSYHFETQFTENEYYNLCINSSTGESSYTYYNKTDGWAGGWKKVSVAHITATHCAPYTGDVTVTKSSTSAWTFQGGVNIPALSFNASAQTGYTTTASVSYHIDGGYTRQLCGVGGTFGGSDPLLVQAQI